MAPSFSLSRAWSFGRHVPPGKLLRRARLVVRRRVSVWLPVGRTGAQQRDLPLSEMPPSPLFAPRTGVLARDGDALAFTFLGRTVTMAGRVDWAAPGPGPADQLWRMNLHYMEYLEGLDAASAADLMQDWIVANPPWRPGYWTDAWNSYAVSLRVVVWMQQLARHGAALAEADLTPILRSLVGQLHFLERNLETDLGGNHLIKNIKALLWASAFFDGPAAQRWRATGLRLLRRELDHQILPDGLHYERSPSYHAQVLADLLEIRHALGADPFDGKLDAHLARMVRAVQDLAHPDGGPALFNDAGMRMAYAPAACIDAWEALGGERPAPTRGFAYPHGGYYGLRDGDFYLALDMGKIGPDDLPAHAHGDVGSFELSVGGQRMIVDQGVHEYIAGPRRAASRATANHNCLTLGGEDQAEFFGAFRCGRRPRVALRFFGARAGSLSLEGSHDGFAHLPGRPVAVRRFDAEPDKISIVDTIEGDADRPLAMGLLLHPEARVAPDRDGGAVVRRGDVTLHISSAASIAIEDAEHWPDMGIALATRRLRLTVPANSREIGVTIRISMGASPEPA